MLFAGVASAGLDRLQIGDKPGDSCPDGVLVARLGEEARAPYGHVARAVSFDLGATDSSQNLAVGLFSAAHLDGDWTVGCHTRRRIS